jgi:hypothetical protein
MMGPKKLSTIRDEMRQALAAEGDPLQWLERLTAFGKGNDSPAFGEDEVTQSLRRLLKAGRKQRRSRAKAKK